MGEHHKALQKVVKAECTVKFHILLPIYHHYHHHQKEIRKECHACQQRTRHCVHLSAEVRVKRRGKPVLLPLCKSWQKTCWSNLELTRRGALPPHSTAPPVKLGGVEGARKTPLLTRARPACLWLRPLCCGFSTYYSEYRVTSLLLLLLLLLL